MSDEVALKEAILKRLDSIEGTIGKKAEEPAQNSSNSDVLWPELQKKIDFFAKNMTIIGAIVTAIFAVIGGGYVFKRTNDMVDDAKAQIREITGIVQPDSASVKPKSIGGHIDTNSYGKPILHVALGLQPKAISDQKIYIVTMDFSVVVEIEGDNGILLGSNRMLSGEVVKYFSKRFDSEKPSVYGGAETSVYKELEFGLDGTLENTSPTISKGNVAVLNGNLVSTFKNCDVAKAVVEDILKYKPDGVLEIQPVFKLIKDAPDPKGFPLEYHKDAVLPCPKTP